MNLESVKKDQDPIRRISNAASDRDLAADVLRRLSMHSKASNDSADEIKSVSVKEGDPLPIQNLF